MINNLSATRHAGAHKCEGSASVGINVRVRDRVSVQGKAMQVVTNEKKPNPKPFLSDK